jgi:hypothetical protein
MSIILPFQIKKKESDFFKLIKKSLIQINDFLLKIFNSILQNIDFI